MKNHIKIDAYDEPVPGGIKFAHVTPTEQYPHGGWFEDLSDYMKVE